MLITLSSNIICIFIALQKFKNCIPLKNFLCFRGSISSPTPCGYQQRQTLPSIYKYIQLLCFNRICPATHNPGHTLLNSKLTTEALVITKTQEKKPKHFYFFVQFVIECQQIEKQYQVKAVLVVVKVNLKEKNPCQ